MVVMVLFVQYTPPVEKFRHANYVVSAHVKDAWLMQPHETTTTQTEVEGD